MSDDLVDAGPDGVVGPVPVRGVGEGLRAGVDSLYDGGEHAVRFGGHADR